MAKAKLWGSQKTDNRGLKLVEWLVEMNLILNNKTISKPIFIRNNYGFIIDEERNNPQEYWELVYTWGRKPRWWTQLHLLLNQLCQKQKNITPTFLLGWKSYSLDIYLANIKQKKFEMNYERLSDICVKCCWNRAPNY